ncbi:hypothetical protein DSCA_19650 [Desulfosarcina alkanivorans]|uniref:Uncharacterized protein n=1 Tax=Desulfosarcina alkanivorans TaxID=571177 RepID=A0A5K7YI32_9BACT|nr:hypothetical protein DSCA_19650 [Desulfosarcina alkanivorans]
MDFESALYTGVARPILEKTDMGFPSRMTVIRSPFRATQARDELSGDTVRESEKIFHSGGGSGNGVTVSRRTKAWALARSQTDRKRATDNRRCAADMK